MPHLKRLEGTPTTTGTAQGLRISARLDLPRLRVTAGTAQVAKFCAGLALLALVIWLMTGTAASTESMIALARFWVFGLALPGLFLWRLARSGTTWSRTSPPAAW